MYVPQWAIIGALIVFAGLAYIALRSRQATAPKTTVPAPSRPANPAVIESLRQNLRLKTGYNEPIIDRLIQFERKRLPNAPLQTLMEAAIERWERDNR